MSSRPSHTPLGWYKPHMVFRFAAVFLLVLGAFFGGAVLVSTGANSLLKQVLGIAIPTLAGLILAIAWWRKSFRPW